MALLEIGQPIFYSIEHSIYVDPDYRGQGIASKLLEILIQDAKAKNYRTIVAG